MKEVEIQHAVITDRIRTQRRWMLGVQFKATAPTSLPKRTPIQRTPIQQLVGFYGAHTTKYNPIDNNRWTTTYRAYRWSLVLVRLSILPVFMLKIEGGNSNTKQAITVKLVAFEVSVCRYQMLHVMCARSFTHTHTHIYIHIIIQMLIYRHMQEHEHEGNNSFFNI